MQNTLININLFAIQNETVCELKTGKFIDLDLSWAKLHPKRMELGPIQIGVIKIRL